MQDLFAACGVCKSWRQLGVHQFFEQPWDACPYIVHTMQLFSLVRSRAPCSCDIALRSLLACAKPQSPWQRYACPWHNDVDVWRRDLRTSWAISFLLPDRVGRHDWPPLFSDVTSIKLNVYQMLAEPAGSGRGPAEVLRDAGEVAHGLRPLLHVPRHPERQPRDGEVPAGCAPDVQVPAA